jgi:hypothetical protein
MVEKLTFFLEGNRMQFIRVFSILEVLSYWLLQDLVLLIER